MKLDVQVIRNEVSNINRKNKLLDSFYPLIILTGGMVLTFNGYFFDNEALSFFASFSWLITLSTMLFLFKRKKYKQSQQVLLKKINPNLKHISGVLYQDEITNKEYLIYAREIFAMIPYDRKKQYLSYGNKFDPLKSEYLPHSILEDNQMKELNTLPEYKRIKQNSPLKKIK